MHPNEQPPKPTIERPPGLRETYPTRDGRLIHVTPIGVEHIRAHLSVIPYLHEAIAQVELPTDGSKVVSQIDLKKPLEKTALLSAPDIGLDGEAWFATRKNRIGASRVTRDESNEMISTVVIAAAPPVGVPDKYILRTAYIGTMSPNEPWSTFPNDTERDAATSFWSRHAFVHDPKVMGEPFKSTWRTVMGEGRKAFEAKAKADAKAKAATQA